MTRARSTFLALIAVLLSPMVANADPITYQVNRSIGVGSVVGTVTTDGTTGAIGVGNVLDWVLTIDDGDGDGPFTLVTGNSGLGVVGSALIASATELLFDFGAAGTSYMLFQNPNTGSGQNWWCATANISCGGTESADAESVNRFGTSTWVARDGLVAIGTAAAVPEPGTLALLGIGLFGMGMARRKKA